MSKANDTVIYLKTLNENNKWVLSFDKKLTFYLKNAVLDTSR